MRSISRGLAVGLAVTVALSSAATVAVLAAYETSTARADLEAGVTASATAFARMIEPALWDVDLSRLARLTEAFARDPRIARVSVRETTTGATHVVEPLQTADTVLRSVAVKRGDDTLGVVTVAFARGYYRGQVMRQIVNAAIVALIMLAATLVALRFMLRRLLRRPLDELSDVVRGYASPERRPLATAVSYAEFVELGNVLDSMDRQIRDQLEALGAANRELGALNRFLAIAAADVEPPTLIAEAARDLRDLFDASRVHANVVTEHGTATTVYADPSTDGTPNDRQATIDVPLVVSGRPVGKVSLGRDASRPFSIAETALAGAVAAQVGSAVSRYRARTAERLLRTAVEQLPESVIITDSDARIVYVNPAFTDITAYLPADALGQDVRELKRAMSVDGIDAVIISTLESGRSWVGRLTNRKKSGDVYFEESMITPVRNDRGEITNFVAIGRDVTAEMKRDEQFRHAQRLDAVGQLAGGVAHDFNNMLGAALMQLELVELEEKPSPTLKQAVDDMRGALERAANLTRQLLVFSRRQAMRVEVHDLNVIVAEMLRMLTRVIGERIEVEFARAADPVTFEGDAGMIEQGLVNLCVNARDAMPSGGRLVIATRTVTLDEESGHPGVWACLEVRDTGTGMTSGVQARMFEPFFTTKEVGQGTGLGLATTHGIVTQHGGWIAVDSFVGLGTTVTLYLPALAGAARATPPAPVAPDVGRGNARVLVVEDEPLVRQMVSHSLRRLGHRVVEATNGPEALAIWSEQRDAIDLVITDMVMPGGVSGVQLVERMRQDDPGAPAILMSGYSLQLTSEALPSGVAFLAKPFSLASLTMAIDGALGRASGREPSA